MVDNNKAAAMEENAWQAPDKVFEVQRTITEGDWVMVHPSRVRQGLADLEAAVVHIFRFEASRIAKLWDVAQPVAEHVLNQNGKF